MSLFAIFLGGSAIGCAMSNEVKDGAADPAVTTKPTKLLPPGVTPKKASPPPGTRVVESTPNAQLNYYGGKVISNVEIVAVNWGPSVDSTVSSGIGGFYSAITNSAYFDFLSEYNTTTASTQDGAPGSNQTIGRGSFVGQVTITPGNTSTQLADSDIQAELQAQIASGALPAPDGNTLYMVDFPPGVTITQGGSQSCVDFCAYHGTMTLNGASVPYGVMPDFSPGSGCDQGCGSDPSTFNNQTSVHSHEMIEAVTDMEVGIGTTVGRPLAWYDTSNGEIGDICNAQQANVAGYTVQKEWSNAQHACVSGPGN
ncbi:MAG: hypothetical protein ACHREM_06825 [Polyangiales bacterium]